MSGYFFKDPDSELELSIDWQNGSLRRFEKVCDDLGWSIRPLEDPLELRVVHQECTPTMSKATFSGGVPGRMYIVTAYIRTSEGRQFERSIMFRVTERNLP